MLRELEIISPQPLKSADGKTRLPTLTASVSWFYIEKLHYGRRRSEFHTDFGQNSSENCTELQFCRKSEIARTASVYAHQEAILARNKTRSLRGLNYRVKTLK